MRRFCQRAWLKEDKVEDYRRLHAAVWPSVLQVIEECNIRNYSIALFGTLAVAYFEYVGDDYEADMKRMDAAPAMLEWWKHSKPCFQRHAEGVYYEDMEEVFYFNGFGPEARP